MDKKIYLTKEGLEELKKELYELTDVKRPEVLSRVSEARTMGDLSENAEYQAAREELEFIDGRISEIEEVVRQVIIIKEKVSNGKDSSVSLGSKVVLNMGKKQEEFTVVGEWEADPGQKKISHESPLGKALIGKSAGDIVEVEAPAGKITYTVLSVA